jgi:L-alanine-DL-glutamate epimerase-like enolase superfamily enzyme
MMLERPIRKVEALVYRYPIAVPVRTSFGTMHDRPAVFIRIEDADGAIGWGEAWCNFPTVGAEHRARVVNELIAPLILKRPFASPRDAFDEITEKTAVLAIQSGESGPLAQAIAGVDIALWDLAARRASKPLWSLLGGTDPRLAVYASGINPDRPERTIGAIRARGHSAFKLKVGFGEELDDRNLRVIREEFGQEIYLAVDANQAWDLKSAIRQGRRFEAYELSWIEEPLRADRPWSEWSDLRRDTRIPLAAGENLAGLRSFSDALAQGVLSVVQPDVAKWGGVSGCVAVGRMIEDAGAAYCPHYLGGGIGLLASAHLLAAIGGSGMLEIDVNENPLRDELCGPLHDIRAGFARLSDAPGLGPAPDVGKLRRFRITEQRISGPQRSNWRKLLSRLTLGQAGQRYEPSKHYMRGPGPKARATNTHAALEK